jgi:hypothetical protein
LFIAEHPAFTRRLDAAAPVAAEQPADAYEKMNRGQRLGVDAVTGFINAIVSLPVMCSFAVIIFDVSSICVWWSMFAVAHLHRRQHWLDMPVTSA